MAKVNNLINERHIRSEEAAKEMSSKWGREQTVTGPVLAIPYYNASERIRSTRYVYLVPDQLDIIGEVKSKIKKRSIFQTAVYSTQISLKGKFNINSIRAYLPKDDDIVIQYDKAILATQIADISGVTHNVEGTFGEQKVGLSASSIDAFGTSYAPLSDIVCVDLGEQVDFSLQINLKGVNKLVFNAVSKQLSIDLKSNWKDPSFKGTNLPDVSTVNENGFHANWTFLNQRNFNGTFSPIRQTYQDYFEVELMMANDHYSKSNRSAKYAVLLIGLTFIAFFFMELLNKKNIHPLQYVLIGLALCLFYTLLVSFAEHCNFNTSYLISTIMTVGLIGIYSKAILKSIKLAGFIITIQTLVYGFVFLIIQLNDFALMAGSLGLFIILAIMMYFSKKIDFISK